MRLRKQNLKEHSKQNYNEIVEWVGNDVSKFNLLFDLFLQDEYRVTQRAGVIVPLPILYS